MVFFIGSSPDISKSTQNNVGWNESIIFCNEYKIWQE